MKRSNCCDASIVENTDLCSSCKEHCEVIIASEFEKWANKWLFEMSANEERELRIKFITLTSGIIINICDDMEKKGEL